MAELKDAVGNLRIKDEAESVLQRQAAEDLNGFGKRPAPKDAVGFGLPQIELQDQPVEGGIEPPDAANAVLDSDHLQRLDEAQDGLASRLLMVDALPVIDWHSGPTPMDAWLNQSAIRMEAGI